MYILYLIAVFPLLIGLVLFAVFHTKIVWIEWFLSAIVSFIIAGMFHLGAICYMTGDIETWSGEIDRATFYPEWVEEYTETVTTTDSEGNVETHTETHYTTHQEYWQLDSNINDNFIVEKSKYDEVVAKFGGKIETKKEYKSGFYSGDPNIYVTVNETKIIIPISSTRIWSNKIKAAPSLFSFSKVPDEMQPRLFDWPKTPDPFVSNRVLGVAANTIRIEDWDKLNATLGPRKHVNLIICGWLNEGNIISEYQMAKWIGGKKNDLVICYGTFSKPNKANWVRVFGWTEHEIVKRNLETIFLSNPIDNSILPKIYEEVCRNYEIKDWSKFDYISIEPSTTIIMLMIIFTICVQCGFYYWAYFNKIESFDDFLDMFRKNKNFHRMQHRWSRG